MCKIDIYAKQSDMKKGVHKRNTYVELPPFTILTPYISALPPHCPIHPDPINSLCYGDISFILKTEDNRYKYKRIYLHRRQNITALWYFWIYDHILISHRGVNCLYRCLCESDGLLMHGGVRYTL